MEHPNIIAARKELRDMFRKIKTPAFTVYVGQAWRDALEKDPETGSQLKHLLQDLKERFS